MFQRHGRSHGSSVVKCLFGEKAGTFSVLQQDRGSSTNATYSANPRPPAHHPEPNTVATNLNVERLPASLAYPDDAVVCTQ